MTIQSDHDIIREILGRHEVPSFIGLNQLIEDLVTELRRGRKKGRDQAWRRPPAGGPR